MAIISPSHPLSLTLSLSPSLSPSHSLPLTLSLSLSLSPSLSCSEYNYPHFSQMNLRGQSVSQSVSQSLCIHIESLLCIQLCGDPEWISPAFRGSWVISPEFRGSWVISPAFRGSWVISPAFRGSWVISPEFRGSWVISPAFLCIN